jgi:hypothetical protein
LNLHFQVSVLAAAEQFETRLRSAVHTQEAMLSQTANDFPPSWVYAKRILEVFGVAAPEEITRYRPFENPMEAQTQLDRARSQNEQLQAMRAELTGIIDALRAQRGDIEPHANMLEAVESYITYTAELMSRDYHDLLIGRPGM